MASERIDIDKRRAALKEIDDAKFGFRHVLAVMVAGTGFFMDAYDLFAINFASTMIGYVYYQDDTNKGSTPPNTDLGLKVSAAVGTFFGQVIFGFLADRLGRKKMYGIELMIIIICTLGTAMAGSGFGLDLIKSILFWRVIMGFGIGGDYPLSAIITSEFATKKSRGAMMGAVFAMQGFGILVAAIVSITVLAGYHELIVSNINYIDYCWRWVLGFGVVPGVLALYFRLTIPETPRYTMDIERNYNKANADISSYLRTDNGAKELQGHGTQIELPKATWSDFCSYFGQWKNGKVLLGTSLSWFLLDIAFYGIGLNNNIILGSIQLGGVKSSNPLDPVAAFATLKNAAVGNIIITLLGTIPGYWVTVLLADRWGRKPIQIMGFLATTVIFIIMGATLNVLTGPKAPWFVFLFTLVQFFTNFGPNATTFIVPGEVFPTRYRSTGHGISAASGKLGAIIAQVGFFKLKDLGGKQGSNVFLNNIFYITAACMFLGAIASTLIPETKGLSLEELANEDDYYSQESKERIKSDS